MLVTCRAVNLATLFPLRLSPVSTNLALRIRFVATGTDEALNAIDIPFRVDTTLQY